MDFVTSVANIRAHIFGIPLKSGFEIKSMAGNIIPAIATTNAIIAGVIVMETLKILAGKLNKCKQVYLNRVPNDRKRLLVPCALDPPRPKCYVCSSKPECTVRLNATKVTIKTLQDKILKGHLNMIAPDVEIDDGKDNEDKFLSDFDVGNNSRLKCDDFLQNYTLNVTVAHVDELEEQKEFEVVGDLSECHPTEEASTNGASSSANQTADDDDDLVVIEDLEIKDPNPPGEETSESRKRPAEDVEPQAMAKRRAAASGDSEDIIEIS
ncbi:SUMO-activating enzyme subunit 2 [Elysia marginata]|uniref:SUMO-activating enzyme subunit 2 n=1 Tax=Elysia marginata TaxID=1093978 RepID=A0AAV4HAW0_9GAST|nr:SUMO-activating enzyme subunit 2 [Elysia marginata]